MGVLLHPAELHHVLPKLRGWGCGSLFQISTIISVLWLIIQLQKLRFDKRKLWWLQQQLWLQRVQSAPRNTLCVKEICDNFSSYKGNVDTSFILLFTLIINTYQRTLRGSKLSDEQGQVSYQISGQDEILSENRHLRLKSPSIPRETTRDELIDSIIHTRTREHRPLPGFKSASDYDERRNLRIDCDKVFDGIILGNGDTICNIQYLKGIGVTHVLNTAEHHVEVNPAKYPCYGIKYYGFHVDDLPEANISRYFPTT